MMVINNLFLFFGGAILGGILLWFLLSRAEWGMLGGDTYEGQSYLIQIMIFLLLCGIAGIFIFKT
jgi:hypothetical protein